MTPILLKFDQQPYNAELALANQDLAIYNTMLASILQAIPGLQLDMAAISSLMADPTGYAFDSIVGDNPLTLGGAPVTRSVAMGMIVIPDTWQAIINAVNSVNQGLTAIPVYKFHNPADNSVRTVGRLALSNIQITNNIFSLTTAYTTALNNKYSVYTTSDNQNAIYTALSGVLTAFQQLQAAGGDFVPTTKLRDLGINVPIIPGTQTPFNQLELTLQADIYVGKYN